MAKEITVCLTSCNRFDLLHRTLTSFFATNTYPIKKFIITEDSTQPEMQRQILANYGDKVELIFNPVNLGIYRSVDNMYNLVDTEYIFHCEDDWQFDGNPNFMQESIDILEERKDVHQIWIRKDAYVDWVENTLQQTATGVNYKMLKGQFCGEWCGFSHNPGLRRKIDYTQMFPNGYAEFILPDKRAVFTEENCNLHARKLGYRAATLMNTCCIHIGDRRSTI